MAVIHSSQKNRILVFISATVVVALALYLFYHFESPLTDALVARMGARVVQDGVLRIPKLILWSILAFLGVRALSTLIFDVLFRIRRGYEAPTLIRNIFSLVLFTILFVLIFNHI